MRCALQNHRCAQKRFACRTRLLQLAQIHRALHGVGTFEKELDMLGCALLPIARECGVPSGSALSVDREKFSKAVEKELAKYPDFTLIREEVTSLDEDIPTIVASGPLTSDALAEQVGKLTGKDRLFFTTLSRLSLNLTA